MKIIKEFKDFAMKGNVIDLAVGVIIGAAFGKIVTSLVNDLVMPPLGLVIGGIDFKDLKIVLARTAAGTPAAAINYGNFLQVVVEFVIIAFAIFLMIKTINVLRRKQAEPASAPPSKQEKLLEEIRDLLKK